MKKVLDMCCGARRFYADQADSRVLACDIRQEDLTEKIGRPADVDPQVWEDWLKARKAPLTQTAWEGVVREAEKAGITVEEAVRCCAEAGWRGFRADWYQNRTATATRKPAARSSELDFDSIDYSEGINPDGTF